MGAWILDGGFGLDHLRWEAAVQAPAPGPGELRLRATAWSLNFRDHLMVTGRYNPRQPLPLVPGSDVAGVVEALGPGVDGPPPGTLVLLPFCPGWANGPLTRAAMRSARGGPAPGAFATAHTVPASTVIPVPRGFSAAEAACLPCAGVTAWRALFADGPLQPGATVLTMGSGGVSSFALDLARMAGARVLALTTRPSRVAALLARGAERVVCTATTPDWSKEALAWTGGEGVDLVIELGGAGTLARSLAAVRPGGTIAVIGVLDGVSTELPLTSLLMRGVRLQGVFVGSTADTAALCRALDAPGAPRPPIGAAFPFSALPAALAHLGAGAHTGKVVLVPDGDPLLSPSIS